MTIPVVSHKMGPVSYYKTKKMYVLTSVIFLREFIAMNSSTTFGTINPDREFELVVSNLWWLLNDVIIDLNMQTYESLLQETCYCEVCHTLRNMWVIKIVFPHMRCLHFLNQTTPPRPFWKVFYTFTQEILTILLFIRLLCG